MYTDHKPLTYSLNLKEPNQRLIHWRLSLAEFDYDNQYKPGKQNVVLMVCREVFMKLT